ncbi:MULTISPECIES: UDP-2,3-diacylglucosamine diphosphatase [Prevotellaceae]|jgi:UDP-2,3-diacylglucosamine hydrolase|uniref:Ser/Thr phosphatase family protein n=1 Tax=Segatella oris F0302 TaxID=649760 RepID=D1QST3_9BACT|nr:MULTISPECIES: UDP-2,3-diacylglucosamine diphosphatase [Prevotellaceae]EFB31764.1 Ser/Thr phosphatase family protein [Segatella oris F0302]OFO79119.1 UDP-2,3-diacylglucosamine hydrolase [Prevotella sp. HMSC077E08]OFP53585.1 UDP-2,3-diacylglucosamine hydrolase [Prevotella sp. HMSC077E09]
MGKNVYFLSDAHLGSLAIPHGRTQERRLVRFLDSIKEKASAVYLLGDMFDFWNEYRYVVPKGYSRFLGKLSELTDNGVEVHFFAGNHDLWTYGYLEEECGVIVHKAPVTTEIYGKVFFLAHGDGLGDPDNKFKILRKLFHNRTCQRLLNFVHPRWGMALGLNWAKHSRLKRADGKEVPFMGEDKEFLVRFARDYKRSHPNIDYFLFGHRHIELDLPIDKSTRMLILGDWIWQFTYAVFDGEHLFLGEYVEGESKF